MWNRHEIGRRAVYLIPVLSLSAVLLLAAGAGTLAAQEEPIESLEEAVASLSGAELQQAVEDSFRVLLLQDGILLQPLDEEAAFGAIEIGDEGLSADGEAVSPQALEEALGQDARVVLALADLDVERDPFAFTDLGKDFMHLLQPFPAGHTLAARLKKEEM